MAGAYTFRSVAVDGVGNSELASRELWDAIVKSAKRKGDKLQLAFDKAGAKELAIK